jgi:hypothetical protein
VLADALELARVDRASTEQRVRERFVGDAKPGTAERALRSALAMCALNIYALVSDPATAEEAVNKLEEVAQCTSRALASVK